jgi:hypothetical protein
MSDCVLVDVGICYSRLISYMYISVNVRIRHTIFNGYIRISALFLIYILR